MFFGGFLDGNEYRNRTDLEKHSYLMGFHDGLMAAPLFGLERKGDTMSETWYERCKAVGNSGQLQAIIDRYVDEHPENWHHPMPSIFHMAVKDICDFEYVSGRDERPLPSRRGYALYRSSEIVGDPVYLATFDAEDSPPFNQANCEDTARLATENAARYPAKLRYFCEER